MCRHPAIPTARHALASAVTWTLIAFSSSYAQTLTATCPPVAAPQCSGHKTASDANPHSSQWNDPFTSRTAASPNSLQRRLSRGADRSPETPEQQQAIVTRLRALAAAEDAAHQQGLASLIHEDSVSDMFHNSYFPDNSMAGAGAELGLPIFLNDSSTSLAEPSAAAEPSSQVNRRLTFLKNSNLRVGVDLQRAGVISWVSSSNIPAPWRDRNLLNIWDQGRLLQQSFYGCVDGSCWAGRPWLFNPVQGGSWQNQPSVTTKRVVDKDHIYVEGHPRNWGGEDIIREVLFTSDVRIKYNYIRVHYKMKYSGSTTHPYMTQEVPAVFVDRRFSVLAYYGGSKPWKNDNNITYSFPGNSNMYASPTERWAAFLDPDTGWGVGVYNAKAWLGITAYRVGADRSTQAWDCSYFAHTIRLQFHPGMAAYHYNVFITVGRLRAIRSTFAHIASVEEGGGASVEADAAEGRSLNPDDLTTLGPTAGQPELGHQASGRGANGSSAIGNVA